MDTMDTTLPDFPGFVHGSNLGYTPVSAKAAAAVSARMPTTFGMSPYGEDMISLGSRRNAPWLSEKILATEKDVTIKKLARTQRAKREPYPLVPLFTSRC